MLATPTTDQIAQALSVVRSPELFCDQPGLRACAWATLMASHGHSVNQLRISQIQRAQRVAQAAIASTVQHIAITPQQMGA